MERSVEFGLAHRSTIAGYPHLCMDEKSVHGRDFATILYTDSGMVLDVIDGRKQIDAETLISNTLSSIQRDNVLTVSIDMWEGFINATNKKLPNARICHDKFHLVKYLNKAVDDVRRREVKQHQELKRSRYLFLKDQMNLTDKQHIRFEAITKANYEVSRAWRIKEDFRDIIKERIIDRAEVFSLFHIWLNTARNSQIPEIIKVAEMFARHLHGIVNALSLGYNNGKAERMNGAIQEIQTIGRGYKDVEHFRTAILFFHGGLTLHKDYLIENVNSH